MGRKSGESPIELKVIDSCGNEHPWKTSLANLPRPRQQRPQVISRNPDISGENLINNLLKPAFSS